MSRYTHVIAREPNGRWHITVRCEGTLERYDVYVGGSRADAQAEARGLIAKLEAAADPDAEDAEAEQWRVLALRKYPHGGEVCERSISPSPQTPTSSAEPECSESPPTNSSSSDEPTTSPISEGVP